MHLLCHHQTCAHTGVCRDVPLRVGSEGLCLLRDTQVSGHRDSSLVWVPEPSPREMKGYSPSAMAANASRTGCLLNTGRVRRRSAQDEIVIQEGNALCFEAIYSAGEALFNKRLLPGFWHGPESGQHCRTWRQRLPCRYRQTGLPQCSHRCSRRWAADSQQTRVFHRSGGGKADDLCLFGSGRNLTCINRGTILDVEQILTVLFKAIVCGQVQRFLGQEPLDEGIRTGGIHRNVSDRVAVSIHKRRLGILRR